MKVETAARTLRPHADGTRRSRHTWLHAAAALLIALGLVYLVKGTYYMFTAASDFRLRWTEQQYVFRGKNPIDVWERSDSLRSGRRPPDTRRDATVDPDLGATDGGYPPWAYATASLVTWPSTESAARSIFGCLNLALLGALLWWSYQAGRSVSRPYGWLLTGSVLATSSICTTFGLGQYGVVVLVALWGCFLLDEGGHWLGAGVLMGIALTKVTLSAPFLIPLVLRGRIKAAATALVYVALGSFLVWWRIDTDPLEMLVQVARSAEHYVRNGYSLVDGFSYLGLDELAATRAAATATLAVAIPVVWIWRDAPWLVHCAVAGTTARLWTYHHHYDNLIEVFLMLALAARAPARPAALAGFILMGLTLWAPARACDLAFFRVFQLATWVACTALLLSLSTRRSAAMGDNGPRSPGRPKVTV